MKILVPVKRVVDYQVHIQVKSDGSGVETQQVKMAMNPFDEIAVEAAVQWHEAGRAEKIIAVSIGKSDCQETLRQALAMGAHEAIHVLYDAEPPLIPLSIAQLLAVMVKQHDVNLVIMGKQAIDDDCNQTGQMLAGMLNWSQATFASRIELASDIDGQDTNATLGSTMQSPAILVTREVDGGLERVRCQLPSVITTDLRLNTPRLISLPHIMQAQKKPLTQCSLSELGVDLDDSLNTVTRIRVEPPAPRQGRGVTVQSLSELLTCLNEKFR